MVYWLIWFKFDLGGSQIRYGNYPAHILYFFFWMLNLNEISRLKIRASLSIYQFVNQSNLRCWHNWVHVHNCVEIHYESLLSYECSLLPTVLYITMEADVSKWSKYSSSMLFDWTILANELSQKGQLEQKYNFRTLFHRYFPLHTLCVEWGTRII